MSIFKSKFLVGVLMVAAVFAVVGFANSADAQSCSITMTLRVGSSGAEVMCLQSKIGVTADGKFGPMTMAAVKAFQASKGLVADGIVGPMTRAALVAAPQSPVSGNCQAGWAFNPVTGQACTGGTTPPAGNGGLQGGAGDITVDGLSTYSSEEVGEGDEDVKVMAFEVEADGSDVDLTSMKVEFFQGTAADAEDFTDYAESVSIWMGSDKVGEADVEDFSESSDVWSKTISLDDAVVEEGDTEKFYVAITALGSIESTDMDTDAWYGGVSSIRFLDADGVTSTQSLTLDVDEEVVDDEVEQTFNFASFADAADVELKVALNNSDDDINEAHVIDVDDTNDTDNVEILSFTLEAEGSDILVTEIPVVFTTTETTGNDPDDLMTSASLWMDGEEIATESFVSSDTDDSSETITFDDLEINIDEGDKAELMVKVDVQDTGSTLDAGDTIMADLTSTEVDAIDAEDASGEDLAAADLTGTANGEASSVRESGLMLKFVSSDADVTTVGDAAAAVPTSDIGTFKIVFDVTAFDSDVYVDKSAPLAAGGSGEADLTVTGTGTVVATIDSSTADEGTNGFLVEEGQTERFTLTTSITATADGFFQVALADLVYALTDIDGNLSYTFNLDEYETPQLFLNSN